MPKLPSKIEIIAGVVVLLCLLGLFLVVKKWHDDAIFYKAESARLSSTLEQERKQEKVSREVTNEHVEKVAEINDPSRKLDPVRVCKPARVSPPAPAPSGTEPAPADSLAGLPASDPGREVSDGLTVYGKRCEVLRQTVESTRVWLEKQRELSRETGG